MNSSDLLPTIYDIDDVQHRDSPASELVNDREYLSGRDIDGNDYDDHNENFELKSSENYANDMNNATLNSDVTYKHNGLDDKGAADIMRDDWRTTDRLVRTSNHGRTWSNDDEAEQDQTKHEAAETQRGHADDERSKKDISESHRHRRNKPFNLVDSGAKRTNYHEPDGKLLFDHGVLDKKTPAVVLQVSGDHHVETDESQSDSHAVSNNARKTDLNMKAIHPVTQMVTKGDVGRAGRSNEGSGLKQKKNDDTNGVEIIEKHAWGTTKRVQKLPSLHLQPIDQVIR